MGSEGPDVHRAAQLARSAPWALEYVPQSLVSFLLTPAGGFRAIFRDEGLGGLYRGTSLALFGVTNGALQFMAYEKMKNWAFERKRRRVGNLGRAWTTDDDKLVRHLSFSRCANLTPTLNQSIYIKSNTAYTILSGASKLGALCATYPYQVIRSRIQVRDLSFLFALDLLSATVNC
jgi:solute carrier family 25 folate transporter 32